MAEEKEQAELLEIDITNMALEDSEEFGIDPNADAWLAAAPIPDGLYKVKLFAGKKPFKQGVTDDHDKFIRAELDVKVMEPDEFKESRMFANVSTYLSDGKDNCTMASLLSKIGVKTGESVTMLKLARLLMKALASEPLVYVEGQWKAWSQNEQTFIKQGMKNFPSLGNGKHNHIIKDKSGADCVARFKIDRFFSVTEGDKRRKGQKSPTQAAPAGGGSRTLEKTDEFEVEEKAK